jgi:hypothetical protein
MHGMDKRFDEHVWTITKMSNIRNQFGIVFCKSLCSGHLWRENQLRVHFLCESSKNKTHWDGSTISQFSLGCFPHEKSIIHCFYCKGIPSCFATCVARIYYILPKNVLMFHAYIHFGLHNHPIAKGDYRESMEVVKKLIIDEVMWMPNTKISSIQLVVSKEFLSQHLFANDNDTFVLLIRFALALSWTNF